MTDWNALRREIRAWLLSQNLCHIEEKQIAEHKFERRYVLIRDENVDEFVDDLMRIVQLSCDGMKISTQEV